VLASCVEERSSLSFRDADHPVPEPVGAAAHEHMGLKRCQVARLLRWREKTRVATAVAHGRRGADEEQIRRIRRERTGIRTEGLLVGLVVPGLVVVGDVAGDPHRVTLKVLRRQRTNCLRIGSGTSA
jgi:hypothetical protein